MYRYGSLLRDGVGVRPDRDEARRWLSKAADREHISARMSLGEMRHEDQPAHARIGLGPYSSARCKVIAAVAAAMTKASMLMKGSSLESSLVDFVGRDNQSCQRDDEITVDAAESGGLQWLRASVLALAECSAIPQPKACEEGGSAHAVLLPLGLLGK